MMTTYGPGKPLAAWWLQPPGFQLVDNPVNRLQNLSIQPLESGWGL